MKIPLPVEFDEEFYDLMHIQRNNVAFYKVIQFLLMIPLILNLLTILQDLL